jgi:hypothetical protein
MENIDKFTPIMNKTLFLILTLIVITSCNNTQTSSAIEKLNKKLNENKLQLSEYENQIIALKQQTEDVEKSENHTIKSQQSDYYRFVKTSASEINVAERLDYGTSKVIDRKHFKDTLDVSDNFFVYEHSSEIVQTSQSDFEAILRDFDQVKSEYADDFFVGVMTFYNGQSLPLETENSNTDIHILIQPTELGFENKMFVISDFYDVDIKSLLKKENSIELTFEHGRFPRKKEVVIIKPELVKFKNANSNFYDFIKQFNKDSIFQMSRVKFPITLKYPDPIQNNIYNKKIIEKRDYKILNFEYKESYRTRAFDKYEQIINVEGNQAEIELIGIDNGISVAFYFDKIEGKWMLSYWIDSST